MKFKRSSVALASAVALTILAGNIGVAAKKRWDEAKTAETTTEIAKAEADSAVARATTVMSLIPTPSTREAPPKVKEVAARGVIRLLMLARESRVTVDNISPESKAGGQSGTAIDQIASSIPMTDGAVKRVPIKMKVGFETLDSLKAFTDAIPQSGGYLSKIIVRKGRADLSIRFVGV